MYAALTWQSLPTLETPLLLLDEQTMQRNIVRMQTRMNSLGVAFRPHVKTSKCPEVARRQLAAGATGITVSTLKEAEEFFGQGFNDILYAVAMVPNKLEHALQLLRAGLHLTLLVESVAAAEMLSQHGRANGVCYEVLIEVDTDGHRSGIEPADPLLLQVASTLQNDGKQGARFKGVLTHAGSSYDLRTPEALVAMAEQERSLCVLAAENLRAAGYPCEVVSIGSTPTALSATSLPGVTEVRAGVYVFFDLVMAGVGICSKEDIALSVLCTVIGHRPANGWIITDGGWMAMSRDRGTQKQEHDFGYGMVCDVAGKVIPELAFTQANQEHGVLQWDGQAQTNIAQKFPIGSQLRIVPNHACATGAQHQRYVVLPAVGNELQVWERFGGW
ncbi:D-serine deaminase-like pyridoxal phosphate-dependent protein [Herbaspirillum sp. Sphag1AN]|uniref:alanine racemase n=1 Tax=unclassified Herbaspirillum TaxID=2624150 RepID=UPI00161083E8|nr:MULTISPECIES: alanine racemase [unclassified Herbaspirillum]MBB3212769.1 D-serine deaminase-like pyridoxal phosphate-dependent protein [Herbaspirillum sp. Sphag1AN]MBB3245966.1 D-serine deaminase-like pyridoxal phosphate-dependent protein [Herbaspirillum sp. Sphag64]